MVRTTNAATSTWTAVRESNQNATGTVASAIAAMRSAPTIIRRRSAWSASAPAHRPNTRYGTASATITSDVHVADPVMP